MIHYVPLEHLPESFHVPEPLNGRFWYDEGKECLAFDGAMYKSTFDRIRGLSSEYDYQRAAEDLFRAAVPEDSQPQHRGRKFGVAAAAVLAITLLAAGIFVWQRMQHESPRAPAQPTITNDLAGN